MQAVVDLDEFGMVIQVWVRTVVRALRGGDEQLPLVLRLERPRRITG